MTIAKPRSALDRLFRRIRIALALLFAFYAAVNASQLRTGIAWPLSAIVLLGLCALLMVRWRRTISPLALWVGLFIVLQALVATPLQRNPFFITMPPELDMIVDVRGDALPGISGPQRVWTDAHGFRTTSDVDYADAKPLRIFAIGASTTEQSYLDQEHTWTHLLQEKLAQRLEQKVEVINTGVSGLRALHHRATLGYILDLEPDVALFLVGANDWTYHARRKLGFGGLTSLDVPYLLESLALAKAVSLEHSLLPRVVGRGFHALGKLSRDTPQEPEDGPFTRIDDGAYYSRQHGAIRLRPKRSFRPSEVDPLYSLQIEKIRARCKEARLSCIFLSQPNGYSDTTSEDYRDSWWMIPPNEPYALPLPELANLANLYNRYLLALPEVDHLSSCDLAAGIEPGFASFYDDLHFNTAGARRVAEVLEPCVLDAVRARQRAETNDA